MLKINYGPFNLKLTETFALSGNSRTHTEVIYIAIHYQELIGYGEASFPPYMAEKREENLRFLSEINLQQFESPYELNNVMKYLNEVSPKHNPTKAAIDMALHDLIAQSAKLSLIQILGLTVHKPIYTSLTIGIGDDAYIHRQLKKGETFKTFKVKLNNNFEYIKHVITLIQKNSQQQIGVDFNGGLTNPEEALEIINWLHSQNIIYIEQPFPVALENNYLWLKERSPIPIFGDESIQDIDDLLNKRHLFDGINVKLMKCGGISNALQMVQLAQSFGLKTMLGCMAESACALTAAANLASLFDHVDLDGHLMIADDLFAGMKVNEGAVIMPAETFGCGYMPVKWGLPEIDEYDEFIKI